MHVDKRMEEGNSYKELHFPRKEMGPWLTAPSPNGAAHLAIALSHDTELLKHLLVAFFPNINRHQGSADT